MRLPPLANFAVCTLIWGTTWLAIKESYAGLSALWAASLRFFLAGIVLLALLWVRRGELRVTRVDIAATAYVGLILFGLDYGLIYWGEQFLASGLTAVLFATTPLFVALFAGIFLRAERWTIRHAAGLAFALLGLALVFRDELAFDPGALVPMLAVVAAAAAAGSSTVVMRRWGRDTDPYLLNGGAMLLGAIALLFASILRGETQGLPHGQIPWLATAYLVLFGSVLSFLLYWDLLHAWGANRASLATILIPMVALVTGAWARSETLTVMQAVGTFLVLAGVGASLWKPRATLPAAAPAPVK